MIFESISLNSCWFHVSSSPNIQAVSIYQQYTQLLSAYNQYPDITKEFTGPKHFVITRVHSTSASNILDVFK